MFGECFRPSVWKQRECHRRRRQEAPANKQMLRGRFGCGRRKSQSQRSNYAGLKITRLQRSVVSRCLCSTHSIPHNKLIRPAQPPWFRMEELMQQHLVSQSHPSYLLQSATLGLRIIFFKSVKHGRLCSDLKPGLYFSRVMWGILIMLTAANANNQSTQLSRLYISGDREVCPEACCSVPPCMPPARNARHEPATPHHIPALALHCIPKISFLNVVVLA